MSGYYFSEVFILYINFIQNALTYLLYLKLIGSKKCELHTMHQIIVYRAEFLLVTSKSETSVFSQGNLCLHYCVLSIVDALLPDTCFRFCRVNSLQCISSYITVPKGLTCSAQPEIWRNDMESYFSVDLDFLLSI